MEIVNDSVELFDDVQRVFRELFTMLGWPSICSFRFDFFMAMQSAGKIQVSAIIVTVAYKWYPLSTLLLHSGRCDLVFNTCRCAKEIHRLN